MKSVKHSKTSRKPYLIKMLPKSMESHPIQIQLGSKIKKSSSKLWKTVVAAKNENQENVTLKNLTTLCFDGSFQNRVKTFQ